MLDSINSRGPEDWDKKTVKKENQKIIAEIAALQRVMNAQEEYSLLIVLQGLDASGKDGVIGNIFSAINPLGCQVKAFKKPTDEEFAHDFLWRVHKHTPGKGMIQIFNRSHYEDILVPSVYGYFSKETVDARYGMINDFERLVTANGTTILKFYLHVSHEKQLERLKERLENRVKFWKHNDGDWESREKWDAFMKVYERIFKECGEIPWQIVPADRNWVKVNYIAKAILAAMKDMDLKWPELDTERFAES